MTPCVTLDTVKLYVRVDDDVEKPMLELMIGAATGLIETRLRRAVVGDVEAGAVCASVEEVPQDIQLAACMLVSYMYEHRDASDEELRNRVMRSMMLDSYIDWTGEEDADESGAA